MKEEKYRFICDSEFYSAPVGNDLAGYLNYMAERNNVSLKDLRLYVWPTRKMWEERQQMWNERRAENERKAREQAKQDRQPAWVCE
jgi:hypothetical protein